MATRNYDKHTDATQAKINILKMLASTRDGVYANKSSLGYAAFPDYSFRWPQGAAFSVAKIARELEDDGLIRYRWSEFVRVYEITQAGRNHLNESAGGKS